MTDNDLISRSALKENISSYVGVWDDDGEFMVGMATVLRGIDSAPAVDAEEAFKHLHWVKEALEMAKQTVAPVIRCKDCKHMNRTGSLRWCNWWARNQTMRDEGFCNFGERRADDATD